MNKKILIVGSKGYLGSQIYLFLKKKRIYDLTCIDNHLYGKTWYNKNFQENFLKIDCRDIKDDFIKNFNTVIFLAGLSNNPIDDLVPNKAYKLVEKYTIEFAKKCKKNNVRFIFPSSCSVYGYGKKIFSENSNTNPLSFYSKNKLNIEKKLLKLSSKSFHPLVLRLATVYGNSSSIRFDLVINMFAGMIINKGKIILNSDGGAMRPHVHIDYVCEVMNYFLKNFPKKTEIINVGENHNNKKIIDIANIFKKVIKKKDVVEFLNNRNSFFKDSLFKKKDPRSYKVNFKKLKIYLKGKVKSRYLENDIKKLLNELIKAFRRNEKFIKNINFYRLQKIKKNLNLNYCDYNLKVKNLSNS